jgi:hypothetical protein
MTLEVEARFVTHLKMFQIQQTLIETSCSNMCTKMMIQHWPVGRFMYLYIGMPGKVTHANLCFKRTIAAQFQATDEGFRPRSRKFQHLTLLPCFSAIRDSRLPSAIPPNSINDAIWFQGLLHGSDVMLRVWAPAYIDQTSFAEYLSIIRFGFTFASSDHFRSNLNPKRPLSCEDADPATV